MNNFNNMMNNPSFQRNQYPSYPTVTTSTNNIVWVQGIEGAKAWQLNPNSMIILLDSETEGKMYIKVSDNIGMSTLRIFNYVEELPSSSSTSNITINNDLDLSQFVTKEELKNLIKEYIDNEQPVSATVPAKDSTSVPKQQPKIISIKK